MMGQQKGVQDQLFYCFNLDRYVPSDHLLRGIDHFLDLSELRQHLAPFYSNTGRPSIDPVLMIRMRVIGYCFGIRSERRLCEEVHLNLAYRWFCHLGLEDTIPDHSTFSKNRHGRFRESDTFRHVFESVLRRCMTEGLVGGEGFAIDASVVKADANRARGVPGEQAWIGRVARAQRARCVSTSKPSKKPTRQKRLSEIGIVNRSGGPLHRRARRRSLLRLFDQLSGRYRRGHHCGCRGDTRVTHR